METIYVLFRQDGFGDLLLIDVLGQGQLNDESVNSGIVVQLVHHAEQFFLGDSVFKLEQSALETACLASKYLVADVCFATAIMAHKYCCQVWSACARGYDVLYLGLDFGLDLSSCCLSINYLHILVYEDFIDDSIVVVIRGRGERDYILPFIIDAI
jgi:hypothetical protein